MNINQREIIAYALIEITEDKKYNNLVLKQTLAKYNSLSTVQKAFITECVNGTLRNLIQIDYIINFYSRTNTVEMKPFILALLRSSVYQLKFMSKVPPSAVCNEAVNLAKEKSFANLAGFVNAVLRNIVRNNPKLKLPKKDINVIEYLSIKYSIEPWLIKYWCSEYDYEQIEDICKLSIQPAYISIAVNTLKTNKDELKKMLEAEEIEVIEGINDSLKIRRTSDITKKQSFIGGYYHVMDESSMLAVDVLDPKEGENIIDLCAAPGGKSFYIAYKSNDKSKISSFDVFEHKLELINKTSERLGIKSIQTKFNNGEIFDSSMLESADKLLIDAPCSGFGMIRKKPDIKYTKTYEDVNSLALLQKRIVKNSYKYLKKGGIMIYSTCTVSKKENIDNVNWILENFDFEPYDISAFLPDMNLKEKHYHQILPGENGMDGFFIAGFKRKE